MRQRLAYARVAAIVVALALAPFIPNVGEPYVFGIGSVLLAYYVSAAVLVIVLVRELRDLRSIESAFVDPLVRAQAALGEAVVVRDGERLSFVSDSFETLTGYAPSEITNFTGLMDLVPVEERGAVLERIATRSQDRFDMTLVRKDGRHISVEIARKALNHGSGRVVVLIRDVTDRKLAEQQLEHRLLHDPQTDLPNAVVLRDRAQQAIATARRQAGSVTLLVVGLDAFQDVAESVGLATANTILAEIGRRLRRVGREVDTVARLPYDAFGILLPDSDEKGAYRVAPAVADALARPFAAGDGREIAVSAYTGIAVWPQHGETADELLRGAEAASRRAKLDTEPWAMFTAEQEIRTTEQLTRLAELRTALKDGQLALHYQPIVDVADRRVVGLEALVRWTHPQRGLLSAGEFVPLAEEAGLVRQLTEVILHEAAADARRLLASPATADLSVSLNLSTRDLWDDRLIEKVARFLRESQLPVHHLVFEVTETSVMRDPERSLRTLHRINALGARVVLDDFGTGHSSLAYLQRLPIDGLKIDRSFIGASDKRSFAIFRAMVDLARSLDLRVVVEGIEDERGLELVTRVGAHAVQGYGIARPMPVQAVEAWISQRSSASWGAALTTAATHSA